MVTCTTVSTYEKLAFPRFAVTHSRQSARRQGISAALCSRELLRSFLLVIAVIMCGCGNTISGGSRDFTLSIDVMSVQLTGGGAPHVISVSAAAANGFS